MTGDLWVALPLACLIGGAFVVYLVARLLHAPNGALALCATVALGLALVALIRVAAFVQISTSLPTFGSFVV